MFANRKHTEQAQIHVKHAWGAKDIPAACAEANVAHWGKGGWIIVRLARPDTAEFRDVQLYLVGSLAVVRRIQRRSGRRNRERQARVAADRAVQLPAAQNLPRRRVRQERLRFSERQIPNPADLKVMADVETRWRLVAGNHRGPVEQQARPAIVVGHVDSLRVSVSGLQEQPRGQPPVRSYLK